MAEGLNKVLLLGNLGADPELKMTQGGQAVLKLRLATTETYLDRNQARQERTEWHSVTMWGKRGEALSRILAKGERIFVEGRIQTSSYEKDGEKRYRTEIVANNIILLGRGKGGGATDEMGGGGYERRAPPSRENRESTRSPASAPPASGGEDFTNDFGGSDDEIPF